MNAQKFVFLLTRGYMDKNINIYIYNSHFFEFITLYMQIIKKNLQNLCFE